MAGVALTALVGAGAGVRLATAGDLAGWPAGVAFIPALALALGVVSRTHRLFQAIYPPLWYAVLNDIRGLDYMGALPGGPPPILVARAAGHGRPRHGRGPPRPPLVPARSPREGARDVRGRPGRAAG